MDGGNEKMNLQHPRRPFPIVYQNNDLVPTITVAGTLRKMPLSTTK
jgi:hypothetical protein